MTNRPTGEAPTQHAVARARGALLAATMWATIMGCGGSSGPRNAAPTNAILAPTSDVLVVIGAEVSIRYRDDDPDDEALTTVFVDRDGDLGTVGDQIELASGVDANGAERELTWNTTGVPLGRYVVVVRTVDAIHPPVVATSTGAIEVRRVPPTRIVFPTAQARTDTNRVTVVGRSLPGADIAAVSVNGVAAVSDDGFQSWRAVVSLFPGDNDLAVVVENGAGTIDDAFEPVRLVRGRSFVGPTDLALDGDRLWILDSQASVILELNLATLALTEFAGDRSESGVALSSPVALATDGTRVLVIDNRELVTIDTTTGVRVEVSGESAGGEGPAFGVPRTLAFRSPPHAFVFDASRFALFSVDLGDGTRTILADPDTGEGDILTQPRGAAIVPDETTAFLLSATPATVYAVNTESGDRSVLSSDLVGFGPRLGIGADLVADFAGARLLVLNSADGSIVGVGLDDGDRTSISDRFAIGPTLTSAAALELDSVRGRLLAADPVRDAIVAIDLATGTRSVLRATDAGSGPSIEGGRVVAVDHVGARTFVTGLAATGFVAIAHDSGARTTIGSAVGMQSVAFDGTRNELIAGTSAGSIVAVHAETGVSRVVSGQGVGTGPALGSVTAIAIDATGDRVFAFDEVLDAVVAVSLVNGGRSIIADDTEGSGPNLRAVFGMAWDGTRLLLVEDALDSLLALDVGTGERTVLSDNDSPGAPWNTLRGLAVAPDGARFFVADPSQSAILSVDPTTGVRAILSGPTDGRGTRLSGPEGLTFDAARGLLATMDVRLGGLILIDPISGDRVVASR